MKMKKKLTLLSFLIFLFTLMGTLPANAGTVSPTWNGNCGTTKSSLNGNRGTVNIQYEVRYSAARGYELRITGYSYDVLYTATGWNFATLVTGGTTGWMTQGVSKQGLMIFGNNDGNYDSIDIRFSVSRNGNCSAW